MNTKYPTSKIQALFMCKRQIEKLRKKVLELIQQPCEDFYWDKNQVKNRKCKIQQKPRTKFNSTNKKVREIQNTHIKELNINKKQRSKTLEAKKLYFKTAIPKKERSQKYIKKRVEKRYEKYQNERQSPKTIQSRNIKPFSINTQSTIDHTEQKKGNSPQSVILYSRTSRVSLKGDDQLEESFLLSQRSHPNPSQLGLLLKSSKHQNKRSKGSFIKISHGLEKNPIESQPIHIESFRLWIDDKMSNDQ